MVFFGAAFATPIPSSCLSFLRRNPRTIQSINLNYKRRLLCDCSERISKNGDMLRTPQQQKTREPESLLDTFRRNKALSVTDLIDSEWCETKKEFNLPFGMPRMTDAMKAGKTRHEKLAGKVVKKVRFHSKSLEDIWAKKFMNFITRAKQLSINGLTRELPLLSYVKGVWVVGVIDEIRMLVTENTRMPSLIETKTRLHLTLPAEPQRRNGRLQLMCYKYLWDNVVTDNFPASKFFGYFGLNPSYTLPKKIQECAASSGFAAKTLEDLVAYFRNTCCTLTPSDDQLLLRYEFQGDNTLIEEDRFEYDSDWLDKKINCSLDFWLGKRPARYVPLEERWKCNYCDFASVCPSFDTTAAHIELS